MTNPPSSKPPVPFSRLIKGLILSGAAFLFFIVIAASQKPQTGPLTLEETAARVSGFRLAAPGAPRPDFLAGDPAASGPVAVYFWPAGCETRCAKEADEFITVLQEKGRHRPILVRQLNSKAAETWLATLPQGVKGLALKPGEGDAFLAQSAESLVIFYSGTSEIGRGRGLDWQRRETGDLIRALGATLYRES